VISWPAVISAERCIELWGRDVVEWLCRRFALNQCTPDSVGSSSSSASSPTVLECVGSVDALDLDEALGRLSEGVLETVGSLVQAQSGADLTEASVNRMDHDVELHAAHDRVIVDRSGEEHDGRR
jgi:hypothetical protein